MAIVVEDAASVLEQWVQDVSNLSPEINHLLEEIEAKDNIAQDCRSTIHARDSSIQKHLKANGAALANPKEDIYCKAVLSSFQKAQAIQEEKVLLADKARVLLDRQIKRLDLQIRSLESAGIIPPDPLLPSLLHPNVANRLPPLSSTATGTFAPLNQIAGNAHGVSVPSTTIANSAIARLVSNPSTSSTTRAQSPAQSAATAVASGISHLQPRSARESSIESKRRRLNVPVTGSSLRQSSTGPSINTPKAGIPASSIRAGSAQPRVSNKKPGRMHLAPPRVGQLNPARKGGTRRKGGRKSLSGLRSTHSDTGDDSALSETENSGSERLSQRGREKDRDGDVEMGGVEEDDEGTDETLYCTCRSVSFGNMVACDNENCPYEWFHWGCVGLTKEPTGKWYCPECRTKVGIK